MAKDFLDTAHERLSATGGYDAANSAANDYTTSNPGAGILKDARFVRDLHDFYRDRDGKSFSNDQEAIDYFYNDRTWRDVNTVSIAADVVDAFSFKGEQAARFSRIQKAWDQVPYFWQEGGRGFWSAAADAVPAALADPTNLIGFGAGKLAATAALQGAKAPVRSALTKVAAREFALNSGIEGASELLIQTREKASGLRDSYSLGAVAESSLVAGALGSAAGTLFEIFPAIRGAKAGKALSDAMDAGDREAIAVAQRALAEEIGPNNAPSLADIDAELAKKEAADVTGTPTTEETPKVPIRPEDEVAEALEEQRARLDREKLNKTLTPDQVRIIDERIANLSAQIEMLDNAAMGRAQVETMQSEIDKLLMDGKEAEARLKTIELRRLKWNLSQSNTARIDAARTAEELEAALEEAVRVRTVGGDLLTDQKVRDDIATAGENAGAGQQRVGEVQPNNLGEEGVGDPRAATNPGQAPESDAGLAGDALRQNMQRALPAPEGAPSGPRVEADANIPAGQQVVTDNAGMEGQAGRQPNEIEVKREMRLEQSGLSDGMDAEAASATAPGQQSTGFVEPAQANPVEVQAAFNRLVEVTGKRPQDLGRELKRLGIDRNSPEGYQAVLARIEEETIRKQASSVVEEIRQAGTFNDNELSLLEELLKLRKGEDGSSIFGMTGDYTQRMKTAAIRELEDKLTGLPVNEQNKARAELNAALKGFESKIGEALAGRADPGVMAGEIIRLTDNIANKYSGRAANVESGRVTSPGARVEQAGVDSLADKRVNTYTDRATGETVNSVRTRPATDAVNPGGETGREGYTVLRSDRIDPNDFEAEAARLQAAQNKRTIDNYQADVAAADRFAKMNAGVVLDAFPNKRLMELTKADLDGASPEVQDAYNKWRAASMKSQRLRGKLEELGVIGSKEDAAATRAAALETRAAKEAPAPSPEADARRTELEDQLLEQRDAVLEAETKAKRALGDRYDNYVTGDPAAKRQIKKNLGTTQREDVLAYDKAIADLEKTKIELAQLPQRSVQERVVDATAANADKPNISPEDAARLIRMKQDGASLEEIVSAYAKIVNKPTPKTTYTPAADFPDGMVPAIAKRNAAGDIVDVEVLGKTALDSKLSVDDYYRRLRGQTKTGEEWVEGFAPRDTVNRPLAAKKGFRTAEEMSAGDLPGPTTAPKIRLYEDAVNDVITVGGKQITVEQAYKAMRRMEQMGIPATVGELEARIQLYDDLSKGFPENIVMPRATRQEAFTALNKLYADDPVAFVNASRILSRLRVPYDMAPRFADATDGLGNIGSFNANTNVIGINRAKADAFGESKGLPGQLIFMHEMGHWGYFNVLNFQDRADYLRFLKDNVYNADGQIDQKKLRGLLGDRASSLPAGGIANTQELFANLFMSYLSDRSLFRAADSFWGRIGEKFKQVIDAFLNPRETPSDLLPIFRKIVADDDIIKNWEMKAYANPEETGLTGEALRKAKQTVSNMNRVTGYAQSLDAAIERMVATGSADEVAKAARELTASIYFSVRRAHWFMPRAGNPNTETVALARDMWMRNRESYEFFRSLDKQAPNYNEMAIDSIVADIQRDFEDQMADYLDAKRAGKIEAGVLPGQDMYSALAERMQMNADLAKGGLNDPNVQIELLKQSELLLQTARRYVNGLETMWEKQTGKKLPPAGVLQAENRGGQNGRYTKVVQDKLKAAETKAARVEKAATTQAESAAKKAPKRGDVPNDSKQTAATAKESVQTRPIADVLKEFMSVDPESKRGIQLATEIADRRRAKPEVPLTKVPTRIAQMDEPTLRRNLQDALNKRNSQGVDQFSSELARRGEFGQEILNLFESRFRKAVDTEVAHTAGEMLEDGIPVNAPESFKALMRPVNHNNPEVQRKARTLLYRMLNLIGEDGKVALGNTEFLTVEAVYRLAGREPPANAKAVFADIQDPAYKSVRQSVRRIAIGLSNNADPFDAIHEVGHLMSRVVLSEAERDVMIRAFTFADANDPIKKRIKELYADRSVTHQAEEYIAENVAQYLAERVAKGDLFKLRDTGDINAVQLRSQIEVIFDRIKEAIAYLFNRMIDNQSMRQQMRQLTFYGDLFGKSRDVNRAASYGKIRNGSAVFAARAEAEESIAMMRSLDPTRYRRLMKFHTEKNADGSIKMFFHGTPNGLWLDDLNAAFRMTGRGQGYNGHGIYITDAPEIADLTYRMEGTNEAREAAVELLRAEGASDALIETFYDLWDYRRSYAVFYKGALAEIEKIKAMAPDLQDTNALKRLQIEADETLDKFRALDEMIGAEFGASSRVIPVAVNIQKGFNFRAEDRYVVGALDGDFTKIDPEVLDLLRQLDDGRIDSEVYFNNIDKMFKADPETGLIVANGEELYRGLSYLADLTANRDPSAFGRGKFYPDGASTINDALAELGYDALRTTHFNSPTRGPVIAHNVIVAFDTPGQMKHMLEADMFDRVEEGLYRSRFREEDEKPFMPMGGLLDTLIASDGNLQRNKMESAIFPWFEQAGAGPKMLNMFSKMMRKDPSASDVLPSFSFPLQLRSNARRMREVSGARWLADFIAPEKGATMFEQHASAVAKEIVPMVRELESLPGADGMVKAYFRKISDLTAGLTHRGTNQPAAFDRIVSAMRRGNMEINKLAPEERAAAQKAVDFFTRYRTRLEESGVRIGMINNYVPQLHDVDAIQRDPDNWVRVVADHFVRMRNKDPNATPLSMADAEASARSAMMKILDEDGLHMEVTAKGARAPRMDNEMQRMIRLDQDPVALQQLEGYLSNDLVSLMAKYADGAERRMAFMNKFGQSNHGYYDYLHTASLGRAGAVELLTTKKVYRKNVPTFGAPVDANVEEVLMRPMPLQMASDLVDKALTMIRNGENAEGVLAEMKAVREQFGFLPGEDKATFDRRAEAIANALVDFSKTKGINATEVGFIDMAFRATQQKRVYSGPSFDNQYRVSRTLRNFNAVTMLGFSTLASIPDAVMPLIRSGSMKDFAKSWAKWATDEDYRNMIRNVGVGVETLLHERYAMLHGTGAGGLSGRRMNGFFNLTGLTPWTNTMREVAGIHGYEAFRTMVEKAQRNYKPGQVEQNRDYRIAKRFLDNYGLGDYAVDPSKRFTDLKAAQDDDQIRVAIIKFVNDSIFSPNPNDIPVWAQTPFGMLAFQLKSYPLMMGRLSADVLKRAKDGDVAPLLYMLTIGTGAGAASLYARDTAQFRGGEDEKSPEARKRSLNKILQEFGYSYDAGTVNVMGMQMDLDQFLGWYAESFLAMGGLGMLLEYFYNLGQQVDNGNFGYTRALSATLGPSMNIPMNVFNVAAGVIDPDTASNAKERTALRDVASRVPILGNIRAVREGAADLAGPASSGGGGGRGFGGGFGGGFSGF